MIEVALNPVSLLISFMTFVAYMYSQTVEVRERDTARAVRARGRVEKNSNKDSIDHSGKTKSNFYRTVKVPGEARVPQNQTQGNTMVLRTQTANLGGGSGMMQIEQPRPAIQHQRSTNFGGYQNQSGLRRQISFNNKPTNMSLSMGQPAPGFQGQGQISQRAFATQAAGMPPLFVGFLTNDVSMNHVQFMMDTYSKASQNVKSKSKSLLRDKIDRALDKKKRGKFDARFMSSSEEDMEEEEYSVQKRRKSKRLLGKRKRSHRKSSSMNIQTTVKGKAFNKGEISQDVFKKSFVKVKTGDSEGLKVAEEPEKQPESPKFASTLKVTKTEQSGSLFDNNIGATQEKKQEESKTTQGGSIGGLFSNIAQKTEEKKTEPATSGGLFTINEVKETKVEEKKTEQTTSSGLFGGNGASSGTGLFSNTVETKKEESVEKKEEKKTTGGGLFSTTTVTVEKKEEKKEQPTSSGLFSNFGTETKQKETTNESSSGLFSLNVQKTTTITETKKETQMEQPALGRKEASNNNQNSIGGLFDNTTTSNNQPTSGGLSGLFSDVATKDDGNNASKITAPTDSLFGNNAIQTEGGIFNNSTTVVETTTTTNNNGGGIGGLFSDNNNQGSSNNQNASSGIAGLFENNTSTNNATSGLFATETTGGAQDNPFMNVSASKSKNENNMQSMISQNASGSLFSDKKESGGGGLFNDGGSSNTIGIFNQNSAGNNQAGQQANPFSNFNGGGGGNSSAGGIFGNSSGGGASGLFGEGGSSGGLFS